jgi:HAMP domain-containing protein
LDKATPGSAKQTSVARRFNRALLIVYLAGIALAAPTIYFITWDQVYSRAERELTTLVNMVRSIQKFVATDLRPFFLEHDMFFSPGFSGIVATSRIAEHFTQIEPDYYIKNASDNPLNPSNRPQPIEMRLLEAFRADRTLDQLIQVGEIDGRSLLLSAAPKVSKPGCLLCHGEPAAAPAEIREQFTGDSGYHYQPRTIVGVSLVGVPLENVHGLTLQRTAIVVAVLTLLFAIIFITINRLVKKLLLAPILRITHAAHEISRGRLDAPIEFERNDEIGDLARSIELVRRSFEKLMKLMKKKS